MIETKIFFDNVVKEYVNDNNWISLKKIYQQLEESIKNSNYKNLKNLRIKFLDRVGTEAGENIYFNPLVASLRVKGARELKLEKVNRRIERFENFIRKYDKISMDEFSKGDYNPFELVYMGKYCNIPTLSGPIIYGLERGLFTRLQYLKYCPAFMDTFKEIRDEI